jgi:hypothetical protein
VGSQGRGLSTPHSRAGRVNAALKMTGKNSCGNLIRVSLVLLCYKQSQAPSVTERAGGELLEKMSGNLNS